MVVNLFGVALNEDEIHLLPRGLSFYPTPCRLNKTEILHDLESFFTCLRLKEFFTDEEEKGGNDVNNPFRPLSTWMPRKGRDAALETYIKRMRTDVESQLNTLRADRQLNNHTRYQKLTTDPTTQYAVDIKQFVGSMATRGLIDNKTKKLLIPRHPMMARFYLLSKIHKHGNLGRPLVSSNDVPTENISRFVDFFLQPRVTQLPSCIRDTTDFINKLRRLPVLSPESLLVTLDVP